MTLMGLVIFLIVGLIAGWLAAKIVEGTGLGLVGDLVVGVIGALIGGWLVTVLGVAVGAGIIGDIISALIGAIILLVIVKLVRSGGRWST